MLYIYIHVLSISYFGQPWNGPVQQRRHKQLRLLVQRHHLQALKTIETKGSEQKASESQTAIQVSCVRAVSLGTTQRLRCPCRDTVWCWQQENPCKDPWTTRTTSRWISRGHAGDPAGDPAGDSEWPRAWRFWICNLKLWSCAEGKQGSWFAEIRPWCMLILIPNKITHYLHICIICVYLNYSIFVRLSLLIHIK